MDKKNISAVDTLSPSQLGMLYETIHASQAGVHVEQVACTLTGQMDKDAFQRAWQWAIQRHTVLRTGFVWEKQVEPLQVVLRLVATPFAYHDWRSLSHDEQQARLEQCLQDERLRGFKLSQPPLMRVVLAQTADDSYEFIWTHHHILMDGWCCFLVLKEVFACYQAYSQQRDFRLAPPRPYKDYLSWLKHWDATSATTFWQQSLHGFTQTTTLGQASDDLLLVEQYDDYSTSQQVLLSAQTTTALQTMTRQRRITLNTILQGVWSLLLSRYSGQDDVLFGITVAGRPAELAGIETMVGLCINTLPLRITLSPDSSLWSWLEGIQSYNLNLRQYEYTPGAQIYEQSELAGTQRLYDSLLVVENYPLDLSLLQDAAMGVRIGNIRSEGARTKYPLTILVTFGRELGITCVYDRRRFSPESIAHVLEHFALLLKTLATGQEGTPRALRALIPSHEIPLVHPLPETVHVGAGIAPRNPIEEMLANTWTDLLGQKMVSVEDDFFMQGGHSLIATQFIARVRTHFQIDLPLRAIFESPTIAQLAEQISAQMHNRGAAHAQPPLTLAPREQALPLSFSQQRLWFLHLLEASSVSYNIPLVIHMQGTLVKSAFERSMAEIVRRHEILRTTFEVRDEQVVQCIAPTIGPYLFFYDLKNLSSAACTRAIQQLTHEEGSYAFDPTRGPLFRLAVVSRSADEYTLLLTIHHLISDGWSHSVLLRELAILYSAFVAGQPSPLTDLSFQYADFALWQRQWLQGQALEQELDYWKRHLQGIAPLEFPTDYPRPVVQTTHGSRQTLVLPAELRTPLEALAQREGVTLFMTLLATFLTLLHRYTSQEDISVGTPIANRTRTELEGLIGFFVNTLVLRTDLSGDPTFRELLKRVREVALDAYANQNVPFEKLVEALHPERDLSRSPLFQVMFVLQNAPSLSETMPNLTLTGIEGENSAAKFDLTLTITDLAPTLHVALEYNTDLFAAETITRVLSHWQTVLTAALAHPEQHISTLAIMTPTEQQQILHDWNDTRVEDAIGTTLPELFAQQALTTPEHVALTFGDQSLSYAELDLQSNQLAHTLKQLGVGPDQLVGVCMKRSLALVVALLGVLKAGGAYVPLDPEYPVERLQYMLADTNMQVMVTQQDLVETLELHVPHVVCLNPSSTIITMQPTTPLQSKIAPNQLAYVIYTSGSTGKPKGTMIPHRALSNFCFSMCHTPGLSEHDHVLAVTSCSFDIAVLELLVPLTVGARITIVDREQAIDSNALSQLIATSHATFLQATPSTWRMLLVSGWQGSPQLRMLCGGEALQRDLARQLLPLGKCLWNMYGPTETTIWSSLSEIEHEANITIGRPIDNTQLYILDHALIPVPIGVVGELYIGGEGLANGYLHRPELSAERFIPDPFGLQPEARMYRTGDQARWRPDGTVECLGRVDHQVKVRGHRIELGEIEIAINTYPAVRESIILVFERPGGDKYLVAYVVSPQQIEAQELRRHLAHLLPDYMIPSYFHLLEALPLLPNGKVDRHTLRAIAHRVPTSVTDAIIAPRNRVEQLLATIWLEILGIEQVGMDDNFFTSGGHSLLATQLISRIRSVLQVELPLRSLFENPTIAGLAEQIDAILNATSKETEQIVPIARDGNLPLSFAQQRLWFLHQLEPESASYNIAVAIHMRGRLNRSTLQRSVQEIVRRHENLRTTFHVSKGQPLQVINPAGNVPLPLIQLEHLTLAEQENEVHFLARLEAQTPFDLAQGPLLRMQLIQLNTEEHVFLVSMHHIISDGWSSGVLIHELTTLYTAFYAGQTSPLPELTIQYADFAAWQRQRLQDQLLATQLTYWTKQLRGSTEAMLPMDRALPAQPTYRGATHHFTFPTTLVESLETLSQQENATLFMTLLSTFQVLLHRYTGQEDIVVGTDIANRTRAELEPLIGFFVNLLALRTNLRGQPRYRELLKRVRETVLNAYTHQDLPFEQIVDALTLERNADRTPLISTLFVLQNTYMPPLDIPELTISLNEIENDTTKFDLAFFLSITPQGLTGVARYNTELFDEATISTMVARFQVLLASVIATPDAVIDTLEFQTQAEKQQSEREENSLRRKLKIAKRDKIDVAVAKSA